ncbi:ATP-binding cassette domain-containing protein [Frigidibacter sp. MR17.14]|uniref:ABC transporter ATP-binding protein n=1 Tax=Frigidibacter sp. MR17.14 TaxID=3126509 RepID=UPI003012F5B2
MTPLLDLRAITKRYPVPGGNSVTAVDAVDFHVMPGEILGIVGESGSGKTTLSRIAARLIPHDEGRITFDGEDITRISGAKFARHPKRRALQMVFQDPLASLNPRFRAREAIGDPVHRLGTAAERGRAAELVAEAARLAGLPERLMSAYPHQMSGGQRARVDIARAIVLRPKMILLDEPTSALDASLQAHVIRTLLDLRSELGLSFIFVSHDLNLVRLISDRLLVMHRGRVVEQGVAQAVFEAPQAEYTKTLIAAIPQVGRRRSV